MVNPAFRLLTQAALPPPLRRSVAAHRVIPFRLAPRIMDPWARTCAGELPGTVSSAPLLELAGTASTAVARSRPGASSPMTPPRWPSPPGRVGQLTSPTPCFLLRPEASYITGQTLSGWRRVAAETVATVTRFRPFLSRERVFSMDESGKHFRRFSSALSHGSRGFTICREDYRKPCNGCYAA